MSTEHHHLDPHIALDVLDAAGRNLTHTAYVLNRTCQVMNPANIGASFPQNLTPQETARGIAWALEQIDEAERMLAHARESFEETMKTLPAPTRRLITPQDRGKKVQLIVRDEIGHDTGLRHTVGILSSYRNNRAAVQIDANGQAAFVPYNICDLEPIGEED